MVGKSPGVVFIQNLLEKRIFAGRSLAVLQVKHGQEEPHHGLTVRGLAQSQRHELPVLHQDTEEDLHLGSSLQSQYKPGVEPLLAGDIVHHQACLVEAECLPGETLLAGVGVGQLEDEVEEVGVPVLEHVLRQDVGDDVQDSCGDPDTHREVLNIADNTSDMNPANVLFNIFCLVGKFCIISSLFSQIILLSE